MKNESKAMTKIAARYAQNCHSVFGTIPFLISSITVSSFGKCLINNEAPLTAAYEPVNDVLPIATIT